MKRLYGRAFSLGGRAMDSVLRDAGVKDRSAGRPKLSVVGRGLSRIGVTMEEPVSQGDQSLDLIALVPHESGGLVTPLCAEEEARLLHSLQGTLGAVDVPKGASVVEVDGTPILVMEWVAGMALDPRHGATFGKHPWEVTAEAAAAVHAAPLDSVAWLGGPTTWKEHGLESLERMRALEHGGRQEAVDAIAWMENHLPPDLGACLLHGDLLEQNILCQIDKSSFTIQSLTLIDWAAARLGDPAYDLAIVTRGVRKPFKEERGLEKLLDAYHGCSGAEITVRQVRFHEVAMLLEWHASTLARPGGAFEAKDIIQRVPRLLR